MPANAPATPGPTGTNAPGSPPVPLPRAAQLGLAFLLGVVVLLLGQIVWQRCLKPDRPSTPIGIPLDLNRASRAEIEQLDGIGPALAERIVAHRDRHGSFPTVDHLKDVSGIGEKTVDRLKGQVRVDGSRRDDSAIHLPSAKPQAAIDLNRATRQQLIDLDGIGPVLADKIIAHRQTHGPFRSVAELTRIKGIKEKTLEKVRPFVYVNDEASVANRNDGA